MQPLGDLPGDGFESYGADISKDGKVVGGYSFSASGIQAFRWENHVMVALPSLPPGGFQCDVRDINGDGSILVGYSYSASGVEAVVWQNGNISRVADISGVPLPNSEAYGVSYDGSVIIGSSSAPGSFRHTVARTEF